MKSMWKFDFSSHSLKFIERNRIDEYDIINNIFKAISTLTGAKKSIVVEKLKGKWKGFFKIRQE